MNNFSVKTPKVTQNLTNMPKKFCEFLPCFSNETEEFRRNLGKRIEMLIRYILPLLK